MPQASLDPFFFTACITSLSNAESQQDSWIPDDIKGSLSPGELDRALKTGYLAAPNGTYYTASPPPIHYVTTPKEVVKPALLPAQVETAPARAPAK